MKSKFDLLRETLEGMAEKGGVEFYLSPSTKSEIRPAYSNTAQNVAEDLLDLFPEEDSENVRAYRSLIFLSRYLKENDLDDDYFIDGPTIEEQLHRLRPKIEDRAHDDVVNRIEVDQNDMGLGRGAGEKVITDPVSKISRKVSQEYQRAGGMDSMVRNTAHEILEAPL